MSSEGYKINPDKIRLRKRNQRQEVTGIVVNEKLQVSRKDRRDFRRVLYYIDKYGLEEHLKYVGNNKNNYIYHLMGKITHASFINPNDKRLKVYQSEITEKKSNSEPAKIVNIDKNGIYVNTKDYIIKLTDIKLEGKKRCSVKDFVNGINISDYIGKVLK